MLDKIRTALRLNNKEFDSEINDLINSAKNDLLLAGITDDDTKPLIARAIEIYCKANFGLDNADSEKYAEAYQKLKDHLSISEDYACISKT